MPMQALRLDPYEHQFHWDPYQTYQALREQDPVHYNEELDLWFLTKGVDVFAAFRDFTSFINTGATSLEKGSTEALPDRKSIVVGNSVSRRLDLGGRRTIK